MPTSLDHAPDYTETITRRELEILSLIAEGKQGKEIAAQLFISPQTVRKHIKNIYRKLEVHNKIEALNKTRWLTTSPQATETYC